MHERSDIESDEVVNSVCPRCKRDFFCNGGSVSRCHCSTVVLTVEQRDCISERWKGCLCSDCLQEFILLAANGLP
ncbi:Cysteine-rich CWC [Alteromonadaceae bacterium 2753L.S.0a.02]|nr:Cysteine-rich CWC [Alteromonadaceae bacterium 2753L.S.0a.02]